MSFEGQFILAEMCGCGGGQSAVKPIHTCRQYSNRRKENDDAVNLFFMLINKTFNLPPPKKK